MIGGRRFFGGYLSQGYDDNRLGSIHGIDRTDNRIDVGVGGRYLLNRNVYLGANFTYTRRDSAGGSAIQSFSRDVFLLRLGGQL